MNGPNGMTEADVLATQIEDGRTIRAFFVEAMVNLFEQEEVFSGKRPLGNSGWRQQLLAAMPQHYSETEAERLILKAIRSL